MWNNIKELIASKKFKVMLFSELGLICGILAGSITSQQGLESGVMLIMVYLGAQGVADFGKSSQSKDDNTTK